NGTTATFRGETLPPRPVNEASKCAGVSPPAPPGCFFPDVVVPLGVSGAFAFGDEVAVVVGGEDAGVEVDSDPPPPPPQPARTTTRTATRPARIKRCATRPAAGSRPRTASSTRRPT